MEKIISYHHIYIVAGAAGVLGKEFVQRLSADPEAYVIACSRNPVADLPIGATYFQSSAQQFTKTAPAEIKAPFSFQLPKKPDGTMLDEIKTVTLIYPIGPFAFDALSPNPPLLRFSGVNPEIYGPNVMGLRNYLRAVYATVGCQQDIRVRLVCFDSISSRERPAFWQGYALCKRIMRRYVKSVLRHFTGPRAFSALIVNTSTIATGAENSVRPGATAEQRQEWLDPVEVVTTTLAKLKALNDDDFAEIDIFHPTPSKPAYNSRLWFNRWQQQMANTSTDMRF